MSRPNVGQSTHAPTSGAVYLWAVALASIALLAYLPRVAPPGPVDLGLAVELVALAVLAQHFPMAFGPQHKLDTSIAVYFACLLLFATPVAVVLVGISQLLGQSTLALRHSPATGKPMRGPRGVLFNTSQLVLVTALAGLVYSSVLPHSGLAPLDRIENLWAIPTTAVTMHLANSLAVAVMVGFQLRQGPREVLLAVRRSPLLERAGLLLIGLVAALGASTFTGAPMLMALPAAILFRSQRQAKGLLASEQLARAQAEEARRLLAFLADASAGLSSSLDYEKTLQTSVGLAVPSLADACSITLDNGATTGSLFAVAPALKEREDRVGELLRRFPSARTEQNGARSELYPALVASPAPEPESQALLDELGPVSAMLVPLVARGQTLGGLALYAMGRTYGSSDLAVAEDLAQRAALAIDNARLYQEQQRTVGRLQLLRGQLEVQERVRLLDDERRRIARELHDRVEQAFFSIGLRVNALLASSMVSPVEAVRDPLADIRDSARQGSADLRAAIFALTRAEVHDLGLVRALWQLVREFQDRTGIEADVVESGPERRAPPEIAEVLHAVAREGLANVEQHARATAAVVSLRFEPDAATLTVQDDGVGAPPLVLSTLTDSTTRFGLTSLREQVIGVGGAFSAVPGDDGGFVIQAWVPIGDRGTQRNGAPENP